MTRTLPRIVVGTLLAVAALALLGCSNTQPQPGGQVPRGPQASPVDVAVGQPAPDFAIETAAGETIALADFQGQPVVVNFWSSTCGYCAKEAPLLDQLYRQYKDQGVMVLGVGTDGAEAIRGKAQELKLTYPVGSNPDAARTYGVTAIPHTFVVDRQGDIVASMLGARPKEELEAEIKKAMQ